MIDLQTEQVVPSIAMVETYVRVLLIAPHALFRSLLAVTLLLIFIWRAMLMLEQILCVIDDSNF